MGEFFRLFILLIFAVPAAIAGRWDPLQCEGSDPGIWRFGQAPVACNMDSFEPENNYAQNYQPIVFEEALSASYMPNLKKFVVQMATKYLKRRKPRVAPEEMHGFIEAVLATAHQESFFSHYRWGKDGKFKVFLGDHGFGMGLMQLDKRYHGLALSDGSAWNLALHMGHSLDEFYANWQRAATAECVDRSTDYFTRARAAWAAYNGGPTNICRWKNSIHINDVGFREKLTLRAWKKYEAVDARWEFDVECLKSKSNHCPNKIWTNREFLADTLLIASDGRRCVHHEGETLCLEKPEDLVCLQGLTQFKETTAVRIPLQSERQLRLTNADRNALCPKVIDGLVRVGGTIETQRSIRLRTRPEKNGSRYVLGKAIRSNGKSVYTPSGEHLQVLDFVFNLKNQSRWYKVSWQGKEGFIYAGKRWDYRDWVQPVISRDVIDSKIAFAGEVISIRAKSGIKLRGVPGKPPVYGVVPYGAYVTVLDQVVQGADAEIFYKIEYDGKQGFIYSGRLAPEDTTSYWIHREMAK